MALYSGKGKYVVTNIPFAVINTLSTVADLLSGRFFITFLLLIFARHFINVLMGTGNESAKWLVVVNPNAGHGKGFKDWDKINSLLLDYGISTEVRFTERKRHATEIVTQAIAGQYRNFIAVGGDGTMNEVVNGVLGQTDIPSNQFTIAMIPVGTGNDWGRMFGIPNDYEGAIRLIKQKNTCLSDAGVASFKTPEGTDKRYFINIAGLGFDAEVVRKTNAQKDKGRSSKAIYFYNLLGSLLFYRNTMTEVIVDGKTFSGKVFTISIGIGKFSGGGMRQTPDARFDDGLFDMTVIKGMWKGKIILSLMKLYDGSILDHPKIDGYKGKNIIIRSQPPVGLEADGESLGSTPLELNILPAAVNVVFSAG
jgi:YegS/Rv2252/BmrU family lipid kinase